MPIPMPTDTAAALGQGAAKCDSRSLLLERFCDPAAKEDDRKQVFTRAFAKPAHPVKAKAWLGWLGQPRGAKSLLHAQLQSRLMVNMAGGVMENAGLSLDRFGLPYIPGSAVKGCARRAALAAFREWCEADDQPPNKPTGPGNPLTPCCAGFTTPAEMLAAIARVFGWCELDWADPSNRSDFVWACNHRWQTLRQTVTQSLCTAFRITPEKPDRPWESLPNFAGSLSFLPAYPVDLGKTGQVDGLPLDVPALGKLELDVVTVHHKQYYAEPSEPKNVPHSDEKWQRWKREHDAWEREWGTAPDIEEPVPNVFPAVAPGHVFGFALASLRGADAQLLNHARTWLKTGLEIFGLGAKTNAGYGWFSANDAVQQAVHKTLEEQAHREREAREREQAEQKRKAEEEARARKAAELKAATANMTPEQRANYDLAQLTDDQFRGRFDQFPKREKSEQEAMVRAMRLPPDQPGSRRKFWDDLKRKAQKGGKPAQIEQAIRQLSKQMNLGKMP